MGAMELARGLSLVEEFGPLRIFLNWRGGNNIRRFLKTILHGIFKLRK